METVDSGYGVCIPSITNFENVIETHSYMNSFEDDELMKKSRMDQLNVGLNVDCKQFVFDARAGATIIGSSTTNTNSYEASYLHEERLFKLEITNFHDERIKFTKDFVSAVNNLPDNFNINESSHRSIYESFFNRWGQFIVVRAYGGGFIESNVRNQLDSGEHMPFDEMKMCMTAAFNGGTLNVGVIADYPRKREIELKSKTLLNSSYLRWAGGDGNFHSNWVESIIVSFSIHIKNDNKNHPIRSKLHRN